MGLAIKITSDQLNGSHKQWLGEAGEKSHTKTKTAANSLITTMTLILFELPSSLHRCIRKAGLDSSKTGSHVRPGEKCHLDLDFAPSPSKMKLFPRRLCWTLDMSRGDSFTRRVPHMQARSLWRYKSYFLYRLLHPLITIDMHMWAKVHIACHINHIKHNPFEIGRICWYVPHILCMWISLSGSAQFFHFHTPQGILVQGVDDCTDSEISRGRIRD